jgi:helix-turn-helix protein
MPAPIPVPVRQKIVERAAVGEPVAALAAALGLAPRTVRHLVRRARLRGPDGVAPDYHPPAVCPHAKPADWHAAVCRLRRDHPTWGAGYILVVLRERHPDRAWPSERTAQRWLKTADLAPAPPGRHPRPDPARATRPHDVWQVDAADCLPLATGEQVCWLRVVDEFTGAALRTRVFPPAPVVPGRGGAGPGRAAPGLRPVGPARADPRG